jgi:isoleucyl-tRNA synthetase
LVRLLAPILVFTTEEIWKLLPEGTQGAGSVHQAEFSEADSLASGISKEAAEQWARLAQVRSAVLVALEQARAGKAIGGGLEAKVRLHARGEAAGLQSLLQERRDVLPALFIVSQVEVEPSAPAGAVQSELFPGLAIKIERADGAKCERCWNYSAHVGENPRYPTVCERCTQALAEIESVAA